MESRRPLRSQTKQTKRLPSRRLPSRSEATTEPPLSARLVTDVPGIGRPSIWSQQLPAE
jgi:hypothetical protein